MTMDSPTADATAPRAAAPACEADMLVPERSLRVLDAGIWISLAALLWSPAIVPLLIL